MDLAWHMGAGSRGLLQPCRSLSVRPHIGDYRELPFRAVAGIHLEAVEEQAGRRKTVVITYLLY